VALRLITKTFESGWFFAWIFVADSRRSYQFLSYATTLHLRTFRRVWSKHRPTTSCVRVPHPIPWINGIWTTNSKRADGQKSTPTHNIIQLCWLLVFQKTFDLFSRNPTKKFPGHTPTSKIAKMAHGWKRTDRCTVVSKRFCLQMRVFRPTKNFFRKISLSQKNVYHLSHEFTI